MSPKNNPYLIYDSTSPLWQFPGFDQLVCESESLSCFLRRRDEGYPLAEHEVLAIQNFLLSKADSFSPLHIVLVSESGEDYGKSELLSQKR